ncbi:MAG: outer membrane beta-barrel protein [Leptolyngbyaceae cyanobacterium bins.349]|nr:outer membrane beta-barrel protein [Leptolyngbyaceae cyanobacterium bins.349]
MQKVFIFRLIGSITVASCLCASPTQAQEQRIHDFDHQLEAKFLQPLESSPERSHQAQAAPTPPTTPPPVSVAPAKSGFYGAISTDARFTTKATLDPLNASLSFNPGFGINAAIGYRFPNNLRLEGEFSYGVNHADEARLPALPGTTTTLTTTIPLTTANAFTTAIAIPIPGVGIIPAGSTIPAGIVLNPGPPFTTTSPITVGGVTIPAGTNLSVIPGLTVTGGGTGTTTVTTPSIPAATVKVDGKISTLSGLINLYYDIPTGTAFEPYIGGGIGVSRASADDLSAGYPGTTIRYTISGSSTAFVYQLRGGVAYHLNSNAAITLGYRYFNVAQQSFEVESLGDLEVDGLGVHNIELGFRYRF